MVIITDKMKRIKKEAVIIYFKVLSQHSPGQTGKYGTYLVIIFFNHSIKMFFLELSVCIIHI
jgi:hypothetical protein